VKIAAGLGAVLGALCLCVAAFAADTVLDPTLPTAPTSATRAQAIIFEWERYTPVRVKDVSYKGRSLGFVCITNYPMVIVEIDGEFFAINGNARGKADRQKLWVEVDGKRRQVLDGNRHTRYDTGFLGTDTPAIIRFGLTLCGH
jgi:hypothetical protein